MKISDLIPLLMDAEVKHGDIEIVLLVSNTEGDPISCSQLSAYFTAPVWKGERVCLITAKGSIEEKPSFEPIAWAIPTVDIPKATTPEDIDH